MAPEASEWGQCKEVEMVPAAPDPEQQQQARSDIMAHQDYYEAEAVVAKTAAKIEEVLSKLQRVRARIPQLLRPAVGSHRAGVGIITSDDERRRLAFMETELSITVAFLAALSPPQNLMTIFQTKTWLRHFLLNVSGLCIDADYFIRDVGPSRQTLLERASQWFQRWKPILLGSHTVQLYYFNEHPCRYTTRHLLLTSSHLGLTTTSQPAMAEAQAQAGALPLVGIDRLAKKILRSISDQQGTMDRGHLRVMSIVGPMGIGKTTLAVELRNRLRQHDETNGGRYYFQCNVIVQAPPPGTTDRSIQLLQDILLQVSEPSATAWSSDPSQPKTMEVLSRLVSECLLDKRYFIIIDGIQEASDWEEIKEAFPDTNSRGSRILITTRSTSIAWACCSDSYDGGLVHKMKPLNEIDSEKLLLAKVVDSVDGCLPDNMKLFCAEILRRCDGIPLFIIGMADWLKEHRLQQLHQREDQIFTMHYLEQVPRLLERLEQTLSSDFNDFPSGLRMLLFSMSMFPSGYKFEKGRLVLKWIHEGLNHYNPSFMDLSQYISEAETFFSQLVDRNVITCVASNCKQNTTDKARDCQWQVNHFIQQFLASKSAEMDFIFTTTTLNYVLAAATAAAAATTTTECGNQTSSSRMPRRLALHHPDHRLPSLLETMDLSQTRSLAVSGTVSEIPLQRFVNLLVLDLEGWDNLKDEDLVQLFTIKMMFLSYLSIRNTRVSKLPQQIKELERLRALDVSHTRISELPLELSQSLVHLDLRGTRIGQVPKQIVQLRHVTLLLIGAEGTINSIKTTPRVPHDVRHLYRLQTLATVDLAQQPASFVRALGDLQELMVLAFTWSFHQSIDRNSREALLSSIRKWEKLKSLTIHCGLGCSMDFLASLEKSGAPRGLKKFKVTAGRFTSVPPWIHGLEFLSFVQITVCKQVTDDLKILGALFKLHCLILGLDFIPGQAIVIGNEGFRELQRFSIDCPMPWLTFSTGAMPKLTYLQLKFCSTPASLICVPSGINCLHRLTEVALCYNAQYINSPSVKMTVEAVTKQVAEHRNPIHLFINGIEQDDVQEAGEVTHNAFWTSSRNNAGVEDDAEAVGEEATAAVQCEITEAES